MQWVNLHFAIYTKAGAQVGSTLPGNALWTGNPNAPVCAARNDGDPIVLYDQYSGRWLASQFAIPSSNGPFYQCVAVSTSNDPSGTWCGYQYQVSTTKLNDYPKFGVWPTQNAYMATINQFIAPNFTTWGGVGVLAFERDKMIACQPARMAYKDMLSDAPASGGACCPRTPTGRPRRRRTRPRR